MVTHLETPTTSTQEIVENLGDDSENLYGYIKAITSSEDYDAFLQLMFTEVQRQHLVPMEGQVQEIDVVVPEGMGPGQLLPVDYLGRRYELYIPEGCEAGTTFRTTISIEISRKMHQKQTLRLLFRRAEALSCGTHQLLSAVAYYCIGYCSIQDGAPMPACCVAVVMVAASVAVAQLDFSMTWCEQMVARVLLLTGPLLSSLMAWAWELSRAVKAEPFGVPLAHVLVYPAFPLATLAHAGWLLFCLRALDVQKQENGSYLPMKFRAVLYLDIFGWFRKLKPRGSDASPVSKRSMDYSQLPSESTNRCRGG
eukprot:g3654.t1